MSHLLQRTVSTLCESGRCAPARGVMIGDGTVAAPGGTLGLVPDIWRDRLGYGSLVAAEDRMRARSVGQARLR